jgi:hypothetical protein
MELRCKRRVGELHKKFTSEQSMSIQLTSSHGQT